MRWLGRISAADIVSLLNGLTGFLAITYILDGEFVTATILIILALIFDGLDGFVARYLGTTHHYGRFIDSISDSVSFCLAPALLVYANFYDAELGSAWVSTPNALAVIASMFIGCFGILRLARFSVKEFGRPYFIGLPTPAMTVTAIYLCVLFGDPAANPFSHGYNNYPILLIFIVLAFLMVSDIPFPKVKGVFIPLSVIAGALISFPLLIYQLGGPEALCIDCLRNIETLALIPILAYLIAGPLYVRGRLKKGAGRA